MITGKEKYRLVLSGMSIGAGAGFILAGIILKALEREKALSKFSTTAYMAIVRDMAQYLSDEELASVHARSAFRTVLVEAGENPYK